LKEEFEDTKGAIRIPILKKNRQHNDQKRKYIRTNNSLMKLSKNIRTIALEEGGTGGVPTRMGKT
jgi:hypothetical protein